MAPEDNPADDVQPTREEWAEFERLKADVLPRPPEPILPDVPPPAPSDELRLEFERMVGEGGSEPDTEEIPAEDIERERVRASLYVERENPPPPEEYDRRSFAQRLSDAQAEAKAAGEGETPTVTVYCLDREHTFRADDVKVEVGEVLRHGANCPVSGWANARVYLTRGEACHEVGLSDRVTLQDCDVFHLGEAGQEAVTWADGQYVRRSLCWALRPDERRPDGSIDGLKWAENLAAERKRLDEARASGVASPGPTVAATAKARAAEWKEKLEAGDPAAVAVWNAAADFVEGRDGEGPRRRAGRLAGYDKSPDVTIAKADPIELIAAVIDEATPALRNPDGSAFQFKLVPVKAGDLPLDAMRADVLDTFPEVAKLAEGQNAKGRREAADRGWPCVTVCGRLVVWKYPPTWHVTVEGLFAEADVAKALLPPHTVPVRVTRSKSPIDGKVEWAAIPMAWDAEAEIVGGDKYLAMTRRRVAELFAPDRTGPGRLAFLSEDGLKAYEAEALVLEPARPVADLLADHAKAVELPLPQAGMVEQFAGGDGVGPTDAEWRRVEETRWAKGPPAAAIARAASDMAEAARNLARAGPMIPADRDVGRMEREYEKYRDETYRKFMALAAERSSVVHAWMLLAGLGWAGLGLLAGYLAWVWNGK